MVIGIACPTVRSYNIQNLYETTQPQHSLLVGFELHPLAGYQSYAFGGLWTRLLFCLPIVCTLIVPYFFVIIPIYGSFVYVSSLGSGSTRVGHCGSLPTFITITVKPNIWIRAASPLLADWFWVECFHGDVWLLQSVWPLGSVGMGTSYFEGASLKQVD